MRLLSVVDLIMDVMLVRYTYMLDNFFQRRFVFKYLIGTTPGRASCVKIDLCDCYKELFVFCLSRRVGAKNNMFPTQHTRVYSPIIQSSQ